MDSIDDAQAMDERIRLAEIASARSQVTGAGADTCEDCGDPIEDKRRRAAPWAVRCLDCQEAAERQKRGR